jgi:hypothetical protein
MRVCKKCNNSKESEEFYTLNVCKVCRRIQREQYKLTHSKEEIDRNSNWYIRNSYRLKESYLLNKDEISQKSKVDYHSNKELYRLKNREKYLKAKDLRQQDPLRQAAYHAKKHANHNRRIAVMSEVESAIRRKKHSEKELQRHHRLYYSDINYKLRKQLRLRLNQAIKNNQKVGSAISDLGCSIDELKLYLESRFLPGMTWANNSLHGWHIDHIKPLSSFDLSDPNQFKQACHYTNLQPLWAVDNLRKGSKTV